MGMLWAYGIVGILWAINHKPRLSELALQLRNCCSTYNEHNAAFVRAACELSMKTTSNNDGLFIEQVGDTTLQSPTSILIIHKFHQALQIDASPGTCFCVQHFSNGCLVEVIHMWVKFCQRLSQHTVAQPHAAELYYACVACVYSASSANACETGNHLRSVR